MRHTIAILVLALVGCGAHTKQSIDVLKYGSEAKSYFKQYDAATSQKGTHPRVTAVKDYGEGLVVVYLNAYFPDPFRHTGAVSLCQVKIIFRDGAVRDMYQDSCNPTLTKPPSTIYSHP